VAYAIAFLEQLAQDVTIDLARVVIVGHSAGGHLALWSAAAHATTGVAAWSPRWRPRGVIGLAAVSDLRLADALDLSDGAVSAVLGRASLPARLAQTSPLERGHSTQPAISRFCRTIS
jgi:acetyl esterase/lipase